MGKLADAVRHWIVDAPSAPTMDRASAEPIERAIQRAIAARQSSFTTAQAMTIPSVIRAVEILASHAAKLDVLAYVEGIPSDPQPRIVARPMPDGRPYDFTYQTVESMVVAGDAFWKVADRDYDRNPTAAIVLDPDEVSVTWKPDRIRRAYSWRGVELNADRRAGSVEIVHIPLGRPAGELRGVSPIAAALDRLAIIAAIEEFAASYFTSGGVPEVVLKSVPRLTANEAADLLAQYMGDGGPRPVRVVSGDVGLDFPGMDPATSQLAQARSHAATEVARLLGIPGALMLIETTGSSVTYTNRSQLVGELYAETLDPLYLAPIEQAWSDLVVASTSVRFEARELQAADLTTRTAIYKDLVAMGAIQPEEVRVLEGWGPDPITSSPRIRATPPPKPIPVPREAIA